MKKVCVLVDWSKAFVDPEGSFYGGATVEEKQKACKLIDQSDIVINFTDVHTLKSKEFISNGGIYPLHNLVDKDVTEERKGSSARLTEIIQNKINEKKMKGCIVIPNNVIYQNVKEPIDVKDILNTFDNLPRLLDVTNKENYNYFVSCKYHFNGTALDYNTVGNMQEEFTAASVLRNYYEDKDLVFYVSGVVTGICIIHTAAGLKQMFPFSKVVIVKDACHPLLGENFGMTSEEECDKIVSSLCKQIGVEYLELSKI